MAKVIQIIRGDITSLRVDAIVNAAAPELLGGGGVDGAIHKKAGIELLEECRKLHGCKYGEAKITNGYKLPAKKVIHTVAPKWYDKNLENKQQLLENCYRNSYKLAMENNIKTIAFTCLGMGVYRVPIDTGTKTSIDIAFEYEKYFDKIYLVCFRDEEYHSYKEYYKEKTEDR